MKPKKITKPSCHAQKSTSHHVTSTNGERVVWIFDSVDRDGVFCFNTARQDFDHKQFLDKLISYSCMTWSEVLSQKHDNKQKTKHHLLDYGSLSKEARDRITALKLEQDTDRIFSFALTNMLRIIGLRDGERFYVKWYDVNHQFCPSGRK